MEPSRLSTSSAHIITFRRMLGVFNFFTTTKSQWGKSTFLAYPSTFLVFSRLIQQGWRLSVELSSIRASTFAKLATFWLFFWGKFLLTSSFFSPLNCAIRILWFGKRGPSKTDAEMKNRRRLFRARGETLRATFGFSALGGCWRERERGKLVFPFSDDSQKHCWWWWCRKWLKIKS